MANNNDKTSAILYMGMFTGRKLFLMAANEKVMIEIHFPSRSVLGVASSDEGLTLETSAPPFYLTMV